MDATPHALVTTGDAVVELTADMTGRWLVSARGTAHVWDLDRGQYTRLPGPGRQAFPYDGEPCVIGRVGLYPRVGAQSIVYFDDPVDAGLEQYRVSSTIARIERLTSTPEPGEGEGQKASAP